MCPTLQVTGRLLRCQDAQGRTQRSPHPTIRRKADRRGVGPNGKTTLATEAAGVHGGEDTRTGIGGVGAPFQQAAESCVCRTVGQTYFWESASETETMQLEIARHSSIFGKTVLS